jgi:hypothetical protein
MFSLSSKPTPLIYIGGFTPKKEKSQSRFIVEVMTPREVLMNAHTSKWVLILFVFASVD